MQTLMYSAGSDGLQFRTAFVGIELRRYGIQIAALNTTWFAEVGEIREVGTGYIYVWIGSKNERRVAGIGFVIQTELVYRLLGLSNGINDRLMTLRLPLSGN